MSRTLLLSFVALASCGSPKPLDEAILGRWDVWCRTDDPKTSTCLGKEDTGLYKIFEQGGALTTGATNGISQQGRWSLSGERLTLTLSGGGMELVENHHARIEGDRLVLWNERGFGAVYGRAGATFEAASSPRTAGGRTDGTLGGVAYEIELPAGYRLARDDNRRQRWAPAAGDGFVVDLSVSPRAQREVDGRMTTVPCNGHDYGGVFRSSEIVDGAQRDIDIGTSICIEWAPLVLMCSTGHTRGWLEQSDEDAALELCRSITVRRP